MAAGFQVVLTNVRLDIPRHSWSPDFYTMSCGQVHVVLPVAQAYVDKARPNVTRWACRWTCKRAWRMHTCSKQSTDPSCSVSPWRVQLACRLLSLRAAVAQPVCLHHGTHLTVGSGATMI